MYFGAFGQANALHTLITAFDTAFRQNDYRGARLRLIGHGPLQAEMKEQVRELNLGWVVSIEPPVPKSQISELASEADVLVLALLPLSLYEYGISLNKLFDYMAAGRPILFAGRARGNPVGDGTGGS